MGNIFGYTSQSALLAARMGIGFYRIINGAFPRASVKTRRARQSLYNSGQASVIHKFAARR
jgi:hypothetical protein